MHELEVPYSPEIKFNLVNKYHSEKNVSINKKKTWTNRAAAYYPQTPRTGRGKA